MRTQTITGIALFISACLQGCATLPADVGTSYKLGLGCFVVSWGDEAVSGSLLSSRSSYGLFRRLGSEEFGAIGYAASSLQVLANGYPFVDGEVKGLVHVRFVPAGKYQLDTFGFHFRSFMTPMAFQTPDRRLPLVIPFEVESGKCTYVGRILTKREESAFRWVDRSAEDMTTARKVLPTEIQRGSPVPVSLQAIPGVLLSQ
jgi:hypothetical protein